MNFAEYQKTVLRTWNPDTNIAPWQVELLCAEAGMSGETGEVSDLIKKGIFHGLPELLDPVTLTKELGDVLYYLNIIAYLFGIPFEEVAEANNRKLLARYPGGFVKGGGKREDEGA